MKFVVVPLAAASTVAPSDRKKFVPAPVPSSVPPDAASRMAPALIVTAVRSVSFVKTSSRRRSGQSCRSPCRPPAAAGRR